MLNSRRIVNVPLRIIIFQIIGDNIRKLRTAFIIIRRLTETIRNGQQFVFLAGGVLVIDIDIGRTESSFRHTVTMVLIDR